MTSPAPIILSLTGPDSHSLALEVGVGSLRIAPDPAGTQHELNAAPDDVINWAVFDDMRTGGGSNWPRWINYEGNDTSLFNWMHTRRTEAVSFTPHKDMELDLSDCKLTALTLYPRKHRMRIVLPRALHSLSIVGNPALVQCSSQEDMGSLRIALGGGANGALTSVANLSYLHQSKNLSIRNAVLGAPFDCKSLLEYRQLRSISLYGTMSHLEALAELQLEALELRFIADLTGLPELSAWPQLRGLIAWNADETIGRRLRKEIKSRSTCDGDHFSVSQLRNREWFVEECGLPFGAWSSKNEKAASKAFKSAAKRLRAANGNDDARAAVVEFVERINQLQGIETAERDDVSVAAGLLATICPDLVSAEQVDAWLNDTRDF